MRIGINLFDLLPGLGRGAGGHVYASCLVRGLAEIDQENQYFLFVNKWNQEMFEVGRPGFRMVVAPFDGRRKWTRPLWEQFVLPFYALKLRLDVVHFPFNLYSFLLRRKAVVTVHDLVSFFYQEKFPTHLSRVTRYQLYLQRLLLPMAPQIVADSEFSKKELLNRLGIDPARVHVVHLTTSCWQQGRVAEHQKGAADAYRILSIVSGCIHKNLVKIIEAFSILRKGFAHPCKLTVVGMVPQEPAVGMYDAQQVRDVIERCGVSEDVELAGFVPDEVLEEMFARADLLTLPSLYEGFGLPVLEAMKRGVPVVTSNRGSLPEVAGDAALCADAEDASDLARAFQRVLTEQGLREDLIRRGYKRVSEFSDWRRVAAETLAVYRKVAGNSRSRAKAIAQEAKAISGPARPSAGSQTASGHGLRRS